jgi:hypothetical protein
VNFVENEIIIPRKKSKSFGSAILMLFSALLLCLPIVIYFELIPGLEASSERGMPLFVVILCIILIPILAICAIFYFRQIFNDKPVLIVNQKGITEYASARSVGFIKWEDIEYINVFPYFDNTFYFCLYLKRPEKYIKNEKLLRKLNNSKYTKKWGHIFFTSLYFKKEFNVVSDTMKYYFEKSKKNTEW